jgi:acetolactate synthase I/II/III large subunit
MQPGALAIKLAHPERKVLAVMGDGSFFMNSQELETAVREKIAFVALVVGGWRLWAYQVEDGPRAWARRLLRLHEPRFRGIRQKFGHEGFPCQHRF